MNFVGHKISASYLMEFDTPLFGMLPMFGKLLARVYEKISLRYNLPLSDLEGMPGPALNEVGIKASLFGGNMTVAWQPGGFQAEAHNLVTDDDVAKVIDVIDIAFTAFYEFCYSEKFEIRPRKTVVRLNAWFRSDLQGTTSESVRQKINASMPIELKSIVSAGDQINYYPNFHIDRTSNGYGVDYLIQESALAEGGVYANVVVTTTDASQSSVNTLATILRDELTQALALFGFSIPLPGQKL